jgi:AraC-like DNA-binding protein
MDALSDMLRVVGLSGGVFLDARFTAPWCVTSQITPEHCRPFMTPPEKVISFHFIVDGSCQISTEDGGRAELHAGDIVMMPRNSLHRLGSRLDLPAVSSADLVLAPEGSCTLRIEHGGGGDVCKMVCGFLGGDGQLGALLSALPPLVKLTVLETPGGEWISESFRYGARQLADGDPGAATVMSKLSELLFVEAVRRYLATMPESQTGLLAGLRDAAIGKVLALMHSQVARAWTTEELAQAVNLSRSALADRFTVLIGMPPMHYLMSWRMQIAMKKLREGKLSIGEIAFDIGYESEAAFARAFKRETGTPPAAWRKRAQDGE